MTHAHHYPGRAADMPPEDQAREFDKFAREAHEILLNLCLWGWKKDSHEMSDWLTRWLAFAPYPVERERRDDMICEEKVIELAMSNFDPVSQSMLLGRKRDGAASASVPLMNFVYGIWQAATAPSTQRTLPAKLRYLARKAADRNETNQARVMREAADALERGAVTEEGRG